MPLAQTATTILLSLVALAMITTSVVSIARDADWWVITRGMARGRAERLARTIRRN